MGNGPPKHTIYAALTVPLLSVTNRKYSIEKKTYMHFTETVQPLLLGKIHLPLLIKQCDLKQVTWEAEHSSYKCSKFATHSGLAPLLFSPHGLKSHLLFQTEFSLGCVHRPNSYSDGRGNLRVVINAADPVQRRCNPAKATIQQRREAGRPGPRQSTLFTYYYRNPASRVLPKKPPSV